MSAHSAGTAAGQKVILYCVVCVTPVSHFDSMTAWTWCTKRSKDTFSFHRFTKVDRGKLHLICCMYSLTEMFCPKSPNHWYRCRCAFSELEWSELSCFVYVMSWGMFTWSCEQILGMHKKFSDSESALYWWKPTLMLDISNLSSAGVSDHQLSTMITH